MLALKITIVITTDRRSYKYVKRSLVKLPHAGSGAVE